MRKKDNISKEIMRDDDQGAITYSETDFLVCTYDLKVSAARRRGFYVEVLFFYNP
jgi:hypothetical protein